MADFHYAPEVQYGYGSTDYPGIVGFTKIDDCIKTAEKWFKSGKVWSSKDRRYVEAPDGRREVTLFKGNRDSQNPSKVIGLLLVPLSVSKMVIKLLPRFGSNA